MILTRLVFRSLLGAAFLAIVGAKSQNEWCADSPLAQLIENDDFGFVQNEYPYGQQLKFRKCDNIMKKKGLLSLRKKTVPATLQSNL